MGETTDQIKSHIDAKRADLQSSISELEDKVHSLTDWRRQFQKHPGSMVAVALGGGALLSLLFRGRKGLTRSGVGVRRARAVFRRKQQASGPGNGR